MARRFKTDVTFQEDLRLAGYPPGTILVVGEGGKVSPLPIGPEGYFLMMVGGSPTWTHISDIPDSAPTPTLT